MDSAEQKLYDALKAYQQARYDLDDVSVRLAALEHEQSAKLDEARKAELRLHEELGIADQVQWSALPLALIDRLIRTMELLEPEQPLPEWDPNAGLG